MKYEYSEIKGRKGPVRIKDAEVGKVYAWDIYRYACVKNTNNLPHIFICLNDNYSPNIVNFTLDSFDYEVGCLNCQAVS